MHYNWKKRLSYKKKKKPNLDETKLILEHFNDLQM